MCSARCKRREYLRGLNTIINQVGAAKMFTALVQRADHNSVQEQAIKQLKNLITNDLAFCAKKLLEHFVGDYKNLLLTRRGLNVIRYLVLTSSASLLSSILDEESNLRPYIRERTLYSHNTSNTNSESRHCCCCCTVVVVTSLEVIVLRQDEHRFEGLENVS